MADQNSGTPESSDNLDESNVRRVDNWRDDRRNKRTNDPQTVVTGTLKEGPHSDVIVFKFSILLVELTFIVTIPDDGKTQAPVYIKFKLLK